MPGSCTRGWRRLQAVYISTLAAAHVRVRAAIIDIECDSIDWLPAAPSTCLTQSSVATATSPWPEWAEPNDVNANHVTWGGCEVGMSSAEIVHICEQALGGSGVEVGNVTYAEQPYGIGCHRDEGGVVPFPPIVVTGQPSRAPSRGPSVAPITRSPTVQTPSPILYTMVPSPPPTPWPQENYNQVLYRRSDTITNTGGCCGAGYMCGFPGVGIDGDIVRLCYAFNSDLASCQWPAGSTMQEMLAACPGANGRMCSMGANSPCSIASHSMTTCGGIDPVTRATLKTELAPAPPTPCVPGVDRVRCFIPLPSPFVICATYTTDPRVGAPITNEFHPTRACGPKSPHCKCQSPLVVGHGRSAHIDWSACVGGQISGTTRLAVWGTDEGSGCPRGRPGNIGELIHICRESANVLDRGWGGVIAITADMELGTIPPTGGCLATTEGDMFKFYVARSRKTTEHDGWTYEQTEWDCSPPLIEINKAMCIFIDDGHNTTRMMPRSRGSGRCPTGSRRVLPVEVANLCTGAATAFPGAIGCRVGPGPGVCLHSGSKAVVWAALSETIAAAPVTVCATRTQTQSLLASVEGSGVHTGVIFYLDPTHRCIHGGKASSTSCGAAAQAFDLAFRPVMADGQLTRCVLTFDGAIRQHPTMYSTHE